MTPVLVQHAPTYAQAALAASGIGTWDFDVPGHRMFCDGAAAALYGFSCEDGERGLAVARLDQAIHPDDRAYCIAKRKMLMERGGLFVNEYRTMPARGVTRWVLARGRYEPDRQGRIVRGRGILIDVTDSKLGGYADGQAFLTRGPANDEIETPLERAAGHVLAARAAIDELGPRGMASLRPAVDALLLELGRTLAAGRRWCR